MQRARRQQLNAINAASLARWIILTAFVAFTGLIYVYLSVQLYHFGAQKNELEKDLASVRSQVDVANVQIAALTSRSALQRRLKEGYLKMIPIADYSIVRLSPETVVPGVDDIQYSTKGEDDIQHAANPRAGR